MSDDIGETEGRSPDYRPPWRKQLKEAGVRHRAFLLYAMQDEDKRSYRMTGSALARGDATVRRWAKLSIPGVGTWEERMAACGPAVQQLALREYGRIYRSTIVPDAAVIERNMSIPFQIGAEPPPSGRPEPLPGEQETLELGPVGKAALAREIAAGTEVARGKETEAARFKTLLAAMIGTAARQVQKGTMKVHARDVPLLIKAHRELQEILEGTASAVDGPSMAPSIRVTQAMRREGGDVTQAMLDDGWEIVTLLQGVKNSEEIARQTEEIRRAARAEEDAEAKTLDPASEAG